ncbi:leucyl aminopeptidase [Azospirillaceae bacterium]
MLAALRAKASADTVPLTPLSRDQLDPWLASQPPSVGSWLAATAFAAEPGRVALIPNAEGRLARVVVGVAADDHLWAYAALPTTLPPGSYRIEREFDPQQGAQVALGWALGAYSFTRYRSTQDKAPAQLIWPRGTDRSGVERASDAITLVRDLINTPAADMGPAELAEVASDLAEEFEGSLQVLVGDQLLEANYPAIHAVGRASPRAPRLIDLSWGRRSDPKVTLVGKGVCFDTGGLDLKTSGNMLLMKKDMGGAAHALGLARMVMMAGLPVRLRVLIPAVDNAVSGDALRPLDVIGTRKGLTVEVGNTDAEGRLILADALAEAATERPALLLDFATLTGAARVALGTDLPALFCNDDALAQSLTEAAAATQDPLWRLPLWQGYRKGLESKIADLSNVASHSYAGAIIAALFLESFVLPDVPWAHFDIMAWNPTPRPGRPEGGEAMTIRAAYAMIERRFGARVQTG